MDLAVFGGRPGEGGRGQGSLGPRRGGEWAGSPPPSPAFCVHFLPLRYADPVSARHPRTSPSPPRPELQTRHFGAARKTRVAGPRRGRIPGPEEIANPESWSSPAPAEMGGRKSLVPMLRGQRRRCPIKANGSGVNHPIVRPHAGTGGCKRCAELLVVAKGRSAPRATPQLAEAKGESSQGDGDGVVFVHAFGGRRHPMDSRDFRKTGGCQCPRLRLGTARPPLHPRRGPLPPFRPHRPLSMAGLCSGALIAGHPFPCKLWHFFSRTPLNPQLPVLS